MATARYITEIHLDGEIYWLISADGGLGFYLSNSSLSVAITFTANTAIGDATLSSVSSFSGLFVGQELSGTGIQSGSRIVSMDTTANTLEMSLAATANGTGITVTRSHMARITDPDFPSTSQGPFVEMDGTVYIGTSEGTIRGSDLNSIVSWSASNMLQTPDDSIVIAKHNDQIAAISKNRITFYFNAGNPSGSLLSRSSSPEMHMGTADFLNVVQFRDWIFFIGQETGPETSGIWMLDGFSLKRLTSIPLTRMLSEKEADTSSNIVTLSAFEHQGKQFVHFGMGTTTAVTASYLYCMESQEWVESGYPYLMKFSEGLNAIALSNTSGIIYTSKILTPTYQDVGAAAYSAIIQTSAIDHGTSHRKTERNIVLVCDQQASGTATLETNDNDYDPNSWVLRGTFDLTKKRPKISRGGTYQGKRAYRITNNSNTPFRAEALEVEVQVEST